MEIKRLTEWLSTAEGLGKAIVALVALPFGIWMAVSTALDPLAALLNWPPQVARLGAGLVLVVIVLLLFVAYRRFANASRVEQPDAFVLHPTLPSALLGRTRDLNGLLITVKRHRLVLLDGESGCGKSALISAGLIPTLIEEAGSLVPVLVEEWSDDWVRGPLAAALDSLFQRLSVEERARMGWKSPPDLAADGSVLTRELEHRLTQVATLVGRRALVILDQFDDYQVVHRQRFLDAEGNWLLPDDLARENDFWGLLSTLLRQDRIHLLVVTRADAAAGLASIRFLSQDETVARTLSRVEIEYLRPLLAGIAPAKDPVVVSHPEHGWYELRDLLERDLRAHGALLMQQVRTVLLGVRQLPSLTPASYLRAGGLQGTETLVISRALRRAAAIDGHPDGLKAARALLAALVRPGGPNQPPKAGRATLTALIEVAQASMNATAAMLRSLQLDELIRPVATTASGDLLQLDHDYLARAVLAEARQANRWSVMLRESYVRFEEARGRWRAQWAALLPTFTLFRLLWERARGRVRFAEARAFALTSTLKPGVWGLLIVVATAAGMTWNEDRLLTNRARQIVDRFGGYREKEAVLEVWRADRALRDRLRQLLYDDDGRMERAVRLRWPVADGGFELPLLMQHSTNLQTWLGRELRDEDVVAVGANIADVGQRIGSAEEGRRIVTSVRTILAASKHSSDGYAKTYSSVTPLLQSVPDIQTELIAFRQKIHPFDDPVRSAQSSFAVSRFNEELGQAYVSLVGRAADGELIAAELAAMRRWLRAGIMSHVSEIADAYAAAAARLGDPAVIASEASNFREVLLAINSQLEGYAVLDIYLGFRDRLHPNDLIRESRALLAEIEQRTDDGPALRAYVHFVQKLPDEEERRSQAARLLARVKALHRGQVGSVTSASASASLSALHIARAAVLDSKRDRSDDRAVIELWRSKLQRSTEQGELIAMLRESQSLTAHFESSSQAAALSMLIRDRATRQLDAAEAWVLVEFYRIVSEGITDVTDLRKEVGSLRDLLLQVLQSPKTPNIWKVADAVKGLSQAYTALVMRLPSAEERVDAAEIAHALNDRLWEDLDDEPFRTYGNLVATLESPEALRKHLARCRQGMLGKGLRASQWSAAYGSIAAGMDDQSLIATEVQLFQDMLANADPSLIAPDIAGPAYAAIAVRSSDISIRREAADLLRTLLEQNTGAADVLASGYALLARRELEDETRVEQTKAIVRQTLTLLSHPYLQDNAPLLAALTPAAGQEFGNDVAAAVRWAQETYGFTPEMLRPVSSSVDTH